MVKHFYERNIIEIRDEYTSFLTTVLAPIVYKGFKSIYEHAVKKRREIKAEVKQQLESGLVDELPKVPSELRIFQVYLRDIPTWNQAIIEKETDRARTESRCADWFDDLVKAVVKSNIVMLTFSISEKDCEIVKKKMHQGVSTQSFIHKIYIECAKLLYNFPELFWHHYEALEIKRNQREVLALIKDGIKEGVRQLLPMKLILTEFLKNDYLKEDDDVEAAMSESQLKNMRGLVDRDLNHPEPLVKNSFAPVETDVPKEYLDDSNLVDLGERLTEINEKLEGGGEVEAEDEVLVEPPVEVQAEPAGDPQLEPAPVETKPATPPAEEPVDRVSEKKPLSVASESPEKAASARSEKRKSGDRESSDRDEKVESAKSEVERSVFFGQYIN